MIPLKLALRNFMCYRGSMPPLSFEGIHLACLSGDNGHGKTALIDAITWALWGEARTRSDDNLVTTGESEMEVEFEFIVGEQRYRIIRKHTRPKRAQGTGWSSLDLFTAEGDGFKAISGVGIKDTEQKISDILHMDYETFINSAYLRQGHADEFTSQPPARRKEVLASILGLSVYDRYEGQAREMARGKEILRTQTESALAQLKSELDRRPALEEELRQGAAELAAADEAVKTKKEELERVRREKDALETKQVLVEQIEAHVRETLAELEFWAGQSSQHSARIAEYEKLITRREEIEAGYTCFLDTKKQNDELDQIFRKTASLNMQKHNLETAIDRARNELTQQHALIAGRILDLEKKSDRLPELRTQLQQARALAGELAAQDKALADRRKAGQELQATKSSLDSSRAQLEKELREIDEKLKLLSEHTGARCPLCERPLEASHLSLIQSKFSAEKQAKLTLMAATITELAQCGEKAAACQKEISHLENELAEARAGIQARIALASKEIADAQEADSKLAAERQAIGEIEERLARREYAVTEQSALGQVEAEVARLDYSQERHEEVRQALRDSEPFSQEKMRLDSAARLLEQEKEAASRAEESKQKLGQSIAADRNRVEELKNELGSLPGLIEAFARVESEHQALVARRDQARERTWHAKAGLERCDELDKSRVEKEAQLAGVAREEGIYRELTRAFGKAGIQAFLIEMALPEIEQEANRLLARMTDNRMHLKFETQRETKKGDTLETLDIKIGDDLGTRSYEMFSGGEAFRINFAIRIALSKLLARRAGTPLRTLIIDEGFGTQDDTGIEKLKEAINSIQDDFSKIIVITHIDELRDAFPSRIEVCKSAGGSTLSVS